MKLSISILRPVRAPDPMPDPMPGRATLFLPLLRPLFLLPLFLPLFLLGGCLAGGTPAGMELTMEESAAEPQPEPGPIKFVWEGEDGETSALITTTTSTTTSPTETFIARQIIEDHRRRPRHPNRIVPPLDPDAPPTPPRREPAITLVPLDGGLVVRKRAAAQSGDVNIGQEANEPVQRLINNAPAGRLSISSPAGGRVTVLGVTQEAIIPGTTKGP